MQTASIPGGNRDIMPCRSLGSSSLYRADHRKHLHHRLRDLAQADPRPLALVRSGQRVDQEPGDEKATGGQPRTMGAGRPLDAERQRELLCSAGIPETRDRAELQRFADELEHRLRGPVDLKIIDWIWDEFERISKYGKHYSDEWRAGERNSPADFHQRLTARRGLAIKLEQYDSG